MRKKHAIVLDALMKISLVVYTMLRLIRMVERKVHSVSLMILMKMRYNIGCRAGKGTSRFVEGRMRSCPSSHPILFNRDAAPLGGAILC